MKYETQSSRYEVYIYNTAIGLIPWVFYNMQDSRVLRNYMVDSDGTSSGGLLAVL